MTTANQAVDEILPLASQPYSCVDLLEVNFYISSIIGKDVHFESGPTKSASNGSLDRSKL